MILAGFYNTGNTCYINSVLQCFVNDKAFRNNIIKKCLVNTNLSEKYLILKTIIERINLKDDEVEFIEEAEDLDEAELNAEMEGLIVLANEFYDREIQRYEE